MKLRNRPWDRTGVLTLLVVGAVAVGCSGNRPDREDLRQPTAAAEGAGRILLSGGTIVRRGEPPQPLDLLLRRDGEFLTVQAAAEAGRLRAPDSVDISGLWVHASHAFDPWVPTDSGSITMYIVRTGAGPGTPARWRIGPYDIERVGPASNHPPGPIDERVGCYVVDRGPWSDPTFELDPRQDPFWFPDSLRLHWQLHWPIGPEPYRVATDIAGQVEGKKISYYGWSPGPGDSLRVVFGFIYGAAEFQGAGTAGVHEGELTVWDHQGFAVQADARLRRVECPDSQTRERQP